MTFFVHTVIVMHASMCVLLQHLLGGLAVAAVVAAAVAVVVAADQAAAAAMTAAHTACGLGRWHMPCCWLVSDTDWHPTTSKNRQRTCAA
jgi:hypothetical protein